MPDQDQDKPKLIKCPGCDLELPEDDLDAQVKHMDEKHPEIIAGRRKEIP